ncbi:MAG TPA: cell division protein FtsH, partial [Amycolatopsis sp.]|nr:cell division protein FtsH [Amycolatopsis sp.]
PDPKANPYAPPKPGAYPNGGRPNGSGHWPQPYGQQGNYPGSHAAGAQGGPPNYGAPPGWTPATSPDRPGQSWRPGEDRPREHGWFADQAGEQSEGDERRDLDGPKHS